MPFFSTPLYVEVYIQDLFNCNKNVVVVLNNSWKTVSFMYVAEVFHLSIKWKCPTFITIPVGKIVLGNIVI